MHLSTDSASPGAPAPGSPAAERGTLRWALAVALCVAALHAPSVAQKYQPNTWLFADGAFYFTTLRALEHGRLEQRALQPQSWYLEKLGWNRNLTDDWSNVAQGREGRWYPKHPVLLPVLSFPLFLMFGTVGTLVTNALLNLCSVLLVFLLARRVCRVEAAALVAVIFAAWPLSVSLSYSFSNDLLGTVLILGALELTLGSRHGLAGVFFGLALWSRITNGVFLPALVVAAFSAGGVAAVGRAALFSLLPLGAYGALNTWMFGAPWITSYQSVLVREADVVRTASHARLFRVPLGEGFRRVILGSDGAFASFPPLVAALAGLVVLALRRRTLALAAALGTVLPSLVYVPYVWYRPQFLYPVFGIASLGLAALLARVVPAGHATSPASTPGRSRWRRPGLLPALAAVLVLGGLAAGLRAWRKPEPTLLSSRVEHAAVFLGDVPCDYWNPQHERWECSHLDHHAWAMTGRILGVPAQVRGEPRRGIWMHPSPTGQWRRLVFDRLDLRGAPARSVELTLALADETRPGRVEVEVLAGGAAVESLTLEGAGSEERRTVPLGGAGGPALELRVRGSPAAWKHLLVEGRLRPE